MNRRDKIRNIVAEVNGIDKNIIKDESLLKYDLLTTSYCLIKIITKIEDEFMCELDNEIDISEDVTFEEFMQWVNKVL